MLKRNLSLAELYQCTQSTLQVLFWGVREMKRVNLTTVDRPQVDIDCAGQVVTSTVIANAKKNPNFSSPITYFDVVS